MSEKYREAGVDIEAGSRVTKALEPIASGTHTAGVLNNAGGFAGLFSLSRAGLLDEGAGDVVLVSATDGVGTKLELANKVGRYDTVGIDCVAMCVNDVATSGARPLFFLDYLAAGVLDEGRVVEVVEGVARGCRRAGCALIGGETAEMPGFYAPGRYDLAGFCVGGARREELLSRDDVKERDTLIGITSSGFHSNGYSLIRKVIEDEGIELGLVDERFDAERTVGEALLEPTRIYVAELREASRLGHLVSASHITGGGILGNLPRALPDELGASLDTSSWSVPCMIETVCEMGGLGPQERYQVFNMGVGMVLVMRSGVDACLERIEGSFVLGEVVRGGGIRLRT